MDPGDRARLEKQREGKPANFGTDFSKALPFLPTMAQNSHMYNFMAERFFLPKELLYSQGDPTYKADDFPHFAMEPDLWQRHGPCASHKLGACLLSWCCMLSMTKACWRGGRGVGKTVLPAFLARS